MNRPSPQDDATNELLDRIAGQLRHQAVPPMPEDCHEFAPTARQSRQGHSSRRKVALLLAVAVALTAIVTTSYFAGQKSESEQRVAEVPVPPEVNAMPESGDGIRRIELMSSANFYAMNAELDKIERELTQLKQQAKLLDARRRAAALLGAMAMMD